MPTRDDCNIFLNLKVWVLVFTRGNMADKITRNTSHYIILQLILSSNNYHLLFTSTTNLLSCVQSTLDHLPRKCTFLFIPFKYVLGTFWARFESRRPFSTCHFWKRNSATNKKSYQERFRNTTLVHFKRIKFAKFEEDRKNEPKVDILFIK